VAKITTGAAIGRAFGGVTQQSGARFTLSLGLTGSQVQQLAHESGGHALTTKQADALASSEVVVDMVSGHGEAIGSSQYRHDADNQIDALVRLGQTTIAEFRTVGGNLYLRINFQGFSAVTDGTTTPGGGFEGMLQHFNNYVPGLGALGRGDWVSVPMASIKGILNEAMAQTPSQALSGREAKIGQLISQIKSDVRNDSTYTNDGDHGGRTEYTITVQAHTLAQQIVQAVSGLLPAGFGTMFNPTQVANRLPIPQTVPVELWVKDNKAEEIDLNLHQLDTKIPVSIPLRLVIGGGQRVSAPSGATPLNLSIVGQILRSRLAGLIA
jgi:hypothetical protein